MSVVTSAGRITYQVQLDGRWVGPHAALSSAFVMYVDRADTIKVPAQRAIYPIGLLK